MAGTGQRAWVAGGCERHGARLKVMQPPPPWNLRSPPTSMYLVTSIPKLKLLRNEVDDAEMVPGFFIHHLLLPAWRVQIAEFSQLRESVHHQTWYKTT
ncbi:hypothetical protein M0R45_037417 [Rubus argutus]|uniref:Uncharacterized protein n=1 Tax=Rubus argutus TaxID=59490 RepID=A0AAW1W023_RUBAR